MLIDFPYIFFYLIMLLLSYEYHLSHKKKIINIAIVLTFVFCGLRAPVVGADTWNYVRYLTGERAFYNSDERELESLFLLYRHVICTITSYRVMVMLINTFLTLLPVCLLFLKFSRNVPLSCLMFFYLDCELTYWVGLRQVLGLSIILLVYYYILTRMNDKGILYKILYLSIATFVSYFIHTICLLYGIICILSLLIPCIHRNLYIVLIIISFVFGIIYHSYVQIDIFQLYLNQQFTVWDRLSDYFDRDEQLLMKWPLIRFSLVGIVSYMFIGKKWLNHPISKMFLVSIMLYNVLFTLPLIHRLAYPLFILGAILFTHAGEFKTNNILHKKQIANNIVVVLLLYLTYTHVMENVDYSTKSSSRMHPYYFIFQDYSDHPSINRF